MTLQGSVVPHCHTRYHGTQAGPTEGTGIGKETSIVLMAIIRCYTAEEESLTGVANSTGLIIFSC